MKLEAEHLFFGYGRQQVLRDLTLRLPECGVLAVIGPNGGGKSTLLKCLGGLLRPSRGVCLLDGKRVTDYPRRELARRIAMLGQFNSAPPELTVRELAEFGRYPHRGRGSARRDRLLPQRAREGGHLRRLGRALLRGRLPLPVQHRPAARHLAEVDRLDLLQQGLLRRLAELGPELQKVLLTVLPKYVFCLFVVHASLP